MHATDTTLLLAAANAGDKAAEARLFERLYADLERMAQHHLLRSGTDAEHAHSLVHEAYLRMAREGAIASNDRRHFFALASRVMRQIVVDYARRRNTGKRGEGMDVLNLDALENVASEASARSSIATSDELLRVEAVLVQLERADESLARLVELHFFGGLTFEEMADVLGRSARSLKRDWQKARMLLHHLLQSHDPQVQALL